MLAKSVRLEICSRLFLYLLQKRSATPTVITTISLYTTAVNNLGIIIKFILIAYSYSVPISFLYMFAGYTLGNMTMMNNLRSVNSRVLKYVLLQTCKNVIANSAKIPFYIAPRIASTALTTSHLIYSPFKNYFKQRNEKKKYLMFQQLPSTNTIINVTDAELSSLI